MLTVAADGKGGDEGEDEGKVAELGGEEKVFTWRGILKADESVSLPLEVGGLMALAKTHDLVVVESVLEQVCFA